MTDAELREALTSTKMAFMLNSSSLFLGSVASKLLVNFDDRCKTASVGAKVMRINPEWFAKCSKRGRLFVYRHEVQHVARLHRLRREERRPDVWNIACDYVINTWEYKHGIGPCSLDDLGGIEPYVDLTGQFDNMDEEHVYEKLMNDPLFMMQLNQQDDKMGEECMPVDEDDGPEDIMADVQIVQEAQEVAGFGGASGDGVTRGAQNALVKFVKPIIRWEDTMRRWCREKDKTHAVWSRPNRRHLPYGFYRPTLVRDIGALSQLNFYRDVSGSVTPEDRDRVFSEMKNLHRKYKPKLMRDVPFNDAIFDERLIKGNEPFGDMAHITCGGTWLGCVKEHIEATKPTAAVIFSDLECAPMEPLAIDIPVLWIVFGSYNPEVPYGTKIYIGES